LQAGIEAGEGGGGNAQAGERAWADALRQQAEIAPRSAGLRQ